MRGPALHPGVVPGPPPGDEDEQTVSPITGTSPCGNGHILSAVCVRWTKEGTRTRTWTVLRASKERGGRRGGRGERDRRGTREEVYRHMKGHEGTRRDGAGARGAEPWFARGGACALPAGRERVSPGLAPLRTGQREHSGLELRPWQ